MLFRVSSDCGAIVSDKINLSNITGTKSRNVEIAAEDDYVIQAYCLHIFLNDSPKEDSRLPPQPFGKIFKKDTYAEKHHIVLAFAFKFYGLLILPSVYNTDIALLTYYSLINQNFKMSFEWNQIISIYLLQ